jgi:hypothetical protein
MGKGEDDMFMTLFYIFISPLSSLSILPFTLGEMINGECVNAVFTQVVCRFPGVQE